MLVIDAVPWRSIFDAMFIPVFSPDGCHVACRVKNVGEYGVFLDDKPVTGVCDFAWDPVFSPDGGKLLIKTVEEGKYHRRILQV